jgi:hypothetical protein
MFIAAEYTFLWLRRTELVLVLLSCYKHLNPNGLKPEPDGGQPRALPYKFHGRKRIQRQNESSGGRNRD